MRSVKNKSTEENREFWSYVETVAEHVRSSPTYANYKIIDEVKSDSPNVVDGSDPKSAGVTKRAAAS